MKRLLSLVLMLLLTGCVTGSLQVNPDDIKTLQTTGNGTSTNGCVVANITGSSGVVGGYGRTVVTWGQLDGSLINWCVGK